jgi:hypothetical protein
MRIPSRGLSLIISRNWITFAVRSNMYNLLIIRKLLTTVVYLYVIRKMKFFPNFCPKEERKLVFLRDFYQILTLKRYRARAFGCFVVALWHFSFEI